MLEYELSHFAGCLWVVGGAEGLVGLADVACYVVVGCGEDAYLFGGLGVGAELTEQLGGCVEGAVYELAL